MTIEYKKIRLFLSAIANKKQSVAYVCISKAEKEKDIYVVVTIGTEDPETIHRLSVRKNLIDYGYHPSEVFAMALEAIDFREKIKDILKHKGIKVSEMEGEWKEESLNESMIV